MNNYEIDWIEVDRVLRYCDCLLGDIWWREYEGLDMLPNEHRHELELGALPFKCRAGLVPAAMIVAYAVVHGSGTAHLGRDGYGIRSTGIVTLKDAEPELSQSEEVRLVQVHVAENFYADSSGEYSLLGPARTLLFRDFDISDYISWSAIALYLGKHDITDSISHAASQLATTSRNGTQIDDQWLKVCLSKCELVVVVGHDGLSIKCAARRKADLDKSLPIIEAFANDVKRTNWYRQYADSLVWDEYRMTYVVSNGKAGV